MAIRVSNNEKIRNLFEEQVASKRCIGTIHELDLPGPNELVHPDSPQYVDQIRRNFVRWTNDIPYGQPFKACASMISLF